MTQQIQKGMGYMYKQFGTDFNCGFGKRADLTVFQSSFFLFVEIDMLC